MKPRALALILIAVFLSCPSLFAQDRAVLDKYCITCHNQKLKTAGLSLEAADFARPSNSADIWEKVIRKLRAGVMPPPGMRRPPLAEYEGLRDWPFPDELAEHWRIIKPEGTEIEIMPPIVDFAKGFVTWR